MTSDEGFIVYVITNIINNKLYFGITKCGIKKRWRNHVSSSRSKSNKHISNAIRKYGKENFDIRVVKNCESEEEMYKLEIELINIFVTTDSKYGYNTSTGGEISSKGVKQSIESIQKGIATRKKNGIVPWNKGKKGLMIAWNKGINGLRKVSEFTREKMRLAHKGNAYCLGYKQSIETIQKRVLKNKGKKRTEKFRKWLSEYKLNNPNFGGLKNRGKVRTDENKRRISETLKARTDNKGSFHNMAILNEFQVLEIRNKYVPRRYSSYMLAKEYGVSRTNIGDIINRKIWKHI